MNETIKKILSPLGCIVCFLSISTILRFFYAWGGVESSEVYKFIDTWGFRYLIVCWVKSDNLEFNYRPCFEYELFMFLWWPVLLPHYLYKTRKGEGLWIFGFSMLLYLLPNIIVWVVHFAVQNDWK